MKPEGQAISPEEKEALIERINEKQKNSKMKILFRNTAGWDAIEFDCQIPVNKIYQKRI